MTSTNDIFSEEQRALLASVLNRIVPAGGEMPGAGDLGIGQFVESVAAGSSATRRLFLDGLVRIELAAAGRGASFESLPAETQTDALRAVETEAPEFFQYSGYANVPGLLHQRSRH